ncbi:CPBP family intramembrane glutamic endopeptidase [Kocuria rosea]|uniref:CPBP family intramembrane glutamic endopeptidase n=1 Tax=Kocuria rosea TaxID=1275 RepID=UPI000D649AAC|nr:CPBP family intramembrane glutamic endopeptidase [Kocuria rosea]PWF84353.1 CAAX protease family protein [Kocuria rosea]
MTTSAPGPQDTGHRSPSGPLARRRPVTVFLVLALGLGWASLTVPALTGAPVEPFLLVLTYVGLLGSALLVTRLADGPGGIRRLLGRAFAWRFGLGRWAVVLLGMPVLTLTLAAATGSLRSPPAGWAAEAGWYLFNTLVFGALVLNLWEETAWGGFLQSRLTARHGLLVAALLTGLPFAAVHLPLYLAEGWNGETARNLALLFLLVPVYRYLLGMHLLDTGGSVLAIGIQHASWNATGSLGAVEGEWQVLVAVVLLTLLVALERRVRDRGTRPLGRDAERRAAAEWTAPRSRGPGTTVDGPG